MSEELNLREIHVTCISTGNGRITIGFEEVNYTNIQKLTKKLCGIIPMGVIDIVRRSTKGIELTIETSAEIINLSSSKQTSSDSISPYVP